MVLDCVDGLYTGLRQTLSHSGSSVQAQERYAVRTAIDQRGEQTIHRDAKTSGGISQFAAQEANVLKWTLNRSEAAANVAALYEMTTESLFINIFVPHKFLYLKKGCRRYKKCWKLSTSIHLD